MKKAKKTNNLFIIRTGKEEINNLKGDDVIVVWGGSNDISKQNSRGALKHLRKFANIYKDVNVIVMPPPQRNDLMPSSCVNSEVIRFNRLMKKSMKLYTNTMILETDLNRDCFTRHGLHMNSLGKDQIMKNLARVIESTAVSNRGPIIELQWRECGLNMDNLDSSQTQQPDDVKQALNHEKNEAPKPQINKRQKKSSPKGPGFFMANLNSPEGVHIKSTYDGTTKTLVMKNQGIEKVQDKNVKEFGLRVLHHNVQSLFNKRNELSMMLSA